MTLFSFIKSQLSIVDVLSDYIQLKHLGNYWKCPCPFHSETQASFTVSPDKQIFYCFGCHESGDAISFIAKIENLTQLEAAKLLIDRYKLNVPQDLQQGAFKATQSQEAKDLYHLMCKQVAEWTHHELLENKIAQEYLAQRFITPTSIKQFSLGYFPGGVSAINRFTKKMAQQGVLQKDLLEYGILLEGQSYHFSPFEERIIFPIKDSLGRFVGFGGRIFKPGDDRAKYYNSRESEGFAKGKLLFGFDSAKKFIQKEKSAFLVEGYMDCIAMIQHGYPQTVATLGTACTTDHLKAISRYTPILYVLFDGDAAGQKAMLRLTELCWEVNLELKIITLPEKTDPASFLSEQGGNLAPLVEKALDIFTFSINSYGTHFLSKPLAEKLAMVEKTTQMIAKINDPLKQDILLQQASSTMNIPFLSLKDAMKKNIRRTSYTTPTSPSYAQELPSSLPDQSQNMDKNLKKESLSSDQDEISYLEESIFSAILGSHGASDNVLKLEPELTSCFSEFVRNILQKLDQFASNQAIPKENFFHDFCETLNEHERTWVIKTSIKYQHNPSAEYFEQLTLKFSKHHWKQIVKIIKEEIIIAKQQNHHELLQELFVKFSKLKQGIQTRGLI